MTPSPLVQKTSEAGRSSQQVSVRWGDENKMVGHGGQLQFEVAECVETRTVTTTTTTKRSYPPLFIREARPLSSLDSKEYPLASRPTPPELTKFTMNVGVPDGELLSFDGELSAVEVCLTRVLLLPFRGNFAYSMFLARPNGHRAVVTPVLPTPSLQSTTT